MILAPTTASPAGQGALAEDPAGSVGPMVTPIGPADHKSRIEMDKRNRISIRLREDVFQALGALADTEMISRNAVIARLIREEAIRRGVWRKTTSGATPSVCPSSTMGPSRGQRRP